MGKFDDGMSEFLYKPANGELEMTTQQNGLSARMLVEGARFDVEYTRGRLERAAERLIDRMESLRRYLNDGMTINSLGEVQGLGQDVDRLCAVLRQQENALETLERVAQLMDIPQYPSHDERDAEYVELHR